MIGSLSEARQATDTWRASLAVRSSCCADCGPDRDAPRRPTARQLTAMYAYIVMGGRKQGAAELGISVTTMQHHFCHLYERAGCNHQVQVAYLLGAGEWAAIGGPA